MPRRRASNCSRFCRKWSIPMQFAPARGRWWGPPRALSGCRFQRWLQRAPPRRPLRLVFEGAIMARVLMEQYFDPPLSDDAYAELGKKVDLCLDQRDAIWVRSYVAADKKRCICEFE